MVQGLFKNAATDDLLELRLFEQSQRSLFCDDLSRALSQPIADPQHVEVLKILQRAMLRNSDAKVDIEFQSVHPAQPKYRGDGFCEALVRLKDDAGKDVKPITLFMALNNTEYKESLGRRFRQWLIPAQMLKFHESAACRSAKKMSLNVFPTDIDCEDFCEAFIFAMDNAYKAGIRGLIIEATEDGCWSACQVRSKFLHGMRDLYGAKIALDDFGAHNGHHTPECLPKLKPDIFKIDGQLVKDYLAYLNNPAKGSDKLLSVLQVIKEYLQEVQEVSLTHTVFEWVGKNLTEVSQIRQALAVHQLDSLFQLVQDMDLPADEDAYLTSMDSEPQPRLNISPIIHYFDDQPLIAI